LKIQSQKEIIEFKLIKTAGYVVHAKVNRTAVITHHDPDHNDEFLNDVEKQCQVRFPNVFLAREKMEIVI
jgi:phosphoribosyl 1,2-cyclic phosphodiesterase